MSNPDLSPSAILEAVLAETLQSDTAADSLADFGGDDNLQVKSTRSFEDAGVLTTNRGLVVRLSNGQEFQVTIVQSR